MPVVLGLAYSLTNWNSMSDVVKFVGLKNFREIFTPNSPYLKSLSITLVFTFFTLVIKETCGLGLALLLNGQIRSKSALRGIFFLPQTLSPLIIGIVFVPMLSPAGVVNAFFRLIGLEGLARAWLVDPKLVLGATILVESWRMIGWNMAILLAGLRPSRSTTTRRPRSTELLTGGSFSRSPSHCSCLRSRSLWCLTPSMV